MFKYTIFVAAFFWISGSVLADNVSNVETTLQCIEQKAPNRLSSGIDLAPARVIELSQPYVFVHGALGWHTTWALLFEVTNDGANAYETYGAQGDIPGAFGRMEVPVVLQNALVECGVKWQGLWPNDWPVQQQREIIPSVEPKNPTLTLPLDDLLPPRQ